MKRKILIVIILILCLGTATFSLINILKWNSDNNKNKVLIDEIQNNTNIIDKQNKIELINPNNTELYLKYASINIPSIDFTDLTKKNSDTIGWIKVLGTNIDYPFVQANNNSYYLNHSFDKKYNSAGWVFLDYRNNIYSLDKNTIIYGHARKDKTMFGSLSNTMKSSWINNNDNHIILISTEKENTLWQIFSIYTVSNDINYITTKFENNNKFLDYINSSLKRSIHNFNTNVDENDYLLTLSTCYGKGKKLVVQAKLIKKEYR